MNIAASFARSLAEARREQSGAIEAARRWLDAAARDCRRPPRARARRLDGRRPSR